MLNSLDDDIISLNEKTHIYSLQDSNIDFTSVTTYIGEFFEKFDQQKIAAKLIQTNIKYAHLTVEELISEWDKSRDYGTLVHKQIEEHVNGLSQASDMKAKNAVLWLNDFVKNKNCDLLVEKIIFAKELCLAGTMDVLIRLKDSNEYIIIDWKTNKKIDTKSYRNKKGILPATSDIADTKFNHYALQLSLYRYLLETYYGLKISQHIIIHLKDHECVGLHAPYMKDNIIKMVETLRS